MKRCKDCKFWKWYMFIDYKERPRWFFVECSLWLHDRNPICLSDEKELYERKWWKFWRPK